MSIDKNKQIADTMRLTYEKRSHQSCHVLELKVNKQRLNKQQQETLKMMFVEAKWCYNYILNLMQNADFDLYSFKGKDLSDITHKDKDMNDISVHLNYITSSVKDSLVDRVKAQLKTLSSLKKKNKKVGKLRFKSEYKSLGLKQLNITHKIVGHNKIKVQGIKKPLIVNGLKQLNQYPDCDIANAVLHKRDDDYYIYLTIYVNKETKNKEYKSKQVGIDFGCETTLTLSDGTKVKAFIEESDRIKNLQKKLERQKKGSNNRYKTVVKLHKEYQRLTNIKDDMSNKIVHKLLSENEQIIIQDEQLTAWKKKHGRKIQHSILGRVKEQLIRHEQVFVLNRFVPTSKLCTECGTKNTDLKLWDRTFVCPVCGCIYDRDVHAAENMVWIYNNLGNKIGLGKSKFKLADFDEDVHRLFCEWDSWRMKQEDANPLG